MPFQPGHKLATGRPKGSANKNVSKLRQSLEAITDAGVEDFNQCLAEVRETNPAKYLEVYLKLLEYSVPKLRQIDNTHEIGDDTLSKIEVIVKKTNE